MCTVDAVNDEDDVETDPFDKHFDDAIDSVSLKLLVLFKCLKLN